MDDLYSPRNIHSYTSHFPSTKFLFARSSRVGLHQEIPFASPARLDIAFRYCISHSIELLKTLFFALHHSPASRGVVPYKQEGENWDARYLEGPNSTGGSQRGSMYLKGLHFG